MGFGINKPGQGYWVRVLTAAFGGVIILIGAAWLWNQLERSAGMIPRSAWVVTISGPAGEAQPGQRVAILGSQPATGAAPTIGSGEVASIQHMPTGAERLEIRDIRMNAGQQIEDAASIAADPSGSTLSGAVTAVSGIPLFDPLYLQAAGVGLLLLVGALVIYWFVGVKSSTVEFLIATDGEMRKVNWSTRKDIIASTWVVIMWSVLIAAGLFAVDTVFAQFFRLIGVLQQ